MSTPDVARREQQSWCPACRAPAGPDCPDKAAGARAAHKRDRRRARTEARAWATEDQPAPAP